MEGAPEQALPEVCDGEVQWYDMKLCFSGWEGGAYVQCLEEGCRSNQWPGWHQLAIYCGFAVIYGPFAQPRVLFQHGCTC